MSAVVWFGCVVAGCGGSNRAEVTGTVRYDGRPLPDASVLFAAESGGRPLVTQTDAQGVYRLTIEREGLPASEAYAVAVSAVDAPAPAAAADSPLGELLAEAGPKQKKAKWRSPERYADAKTSGLACTVERGRANKIDFDLVD